MTNFDLDNLENVAKAATQGKWEYLPQHAVGGCAIVPVEGRAVIPDAWKIENNDCDYITTFDPPMILSMIEYIRSLEDRLEESSKL